MTNDQANAANVLESTLGLIRQILVKHETAVLSEFRLILEAKKHELKLIYAERDKQAALVKRLREQAWILTRDRRPENGDPVIVFDSAASHMRRVAYYETAGKGGWHWCGYEGVCNPEAWMPIPTFEG